MKKNEKPIYFQIQNLLVFCIHQILQTSPANSKYCCLLTIALSWNFSKSFLIFHKFHDVSLDFLCAFFSAAARFFYISGRADVSIAAFEEAARCAGDRLCFICLCLIFSFFNYCANFTYMMMCGTFS